MGVPQEKKECEDDSRNDERAAKSEHDSSGGVSGQQTSGSL